MTGKVGINLDRAAESIESCIRDALEKTGRKGVVLGLSGGLDSSTTAYLATLALGPDRVHALIMPDRETAQRDIRDALLVAEKLGISYSIIDITDTVSSVLRAFATTYELSPRVPRGNVKARVRMVMLYYYSNTHESLVAATSDRSEYLIGYYTKWGDAAGDIYPLLSLYKTQVRALAERLGVPGEILSKPSSPGLWPGQTAESEIGLSYEIIDPVLEALVDLHLDIPEASRITGVPLETVERIWNTVLSSSHKRNPVRACPVGEV